MAINKHQQEHIVIGGLYEQDVLAMFESIRSGKFENKHLTIPPQMKMILQPLQHVANNGNYCGCIGTVGPYHHEGCDAHQDDCASQAQGCIRRRQLRAYHPHIHQPGS